MELLVVIAIIGLLIALLLPAVQAAREAARVTQCKNNLKQLGLAILNYERANGVFPPSSQWSVADGANIYTANQRKFSPNWGVLILPYLEQQPVYDAFDFTKYLNDAKNAPARNTGLAVMLCPSDSYNRTPFNGSSRTSTNAMGDGWARGNYAANAALGCQNDKTHCSSFGNAVNCAAFGDAPGWKDKRLRGIMGANVALQVAHITDGLSNTLLLGEVRAGLTEYDPRGVWAMGGGASALWGHGSLMGDGNGPNSSGNGGDNLPSCNDLLAAHGCSAWTNCPPLARVRMTCYPAVHNQHVTRSMHVGGVLVCFADGSVHWIGDHIDTTGNIGANPSVHSVWDRLCVSTDGNPLSGVEY